MKIVSRMIVLGRKIRERIEEAICQSVQTDGFLTMYCPAEGEAIEIA